MSSIDQQFVEFVVKSLVSKPDEVKVERRIDEKGVLLELTVDPEDLGRVIGKRGATAQSLRTLLRALGTKNDARYNLKIVDNGLPGARHSNTADASQDQSPPSSPVVPANEENNDVEFKEAPLESVEQEAVPEEDTSGHSDRMQQTRKELEDLDDLDV